LSGRQEGQGGRFAAVASALRFAIQLVRHPVLPDGLAQVGQST
jgi:hypothetical protein